MSDKENIDQINQQIAQRKANILAALQKSGLKSVHQKDSASPDNPKITKDSALQDSP